MKTEFTINGIRFKVARNLEGDWDSDIRLDLLALPAFSQALDIKCNDLAQIPLNVYAKTLGGRVRQETQLAWRLFTQPNDGQNGYSFWRTACMQMVIGECFILICPDGQLKMLPFGYTIRYTAMDGTVRYAVLLTDDECKAQGLDPRTLHIKDDYSYGQVLHLWQSQDEHGNVIPLRDRFKSVLGLHSDTITYISNIYNRGGVVAGYLTSDQEVTVEKKKENITWFKKMFRLARKSPEIIGNDMKMSFLDLGTKFQSLNLTPQEMMLAEQKLDCTRDTAKIINLPLWKLGVVEAYKYASSETANRDYLQSSLNPNLCQIERELNAKLFSGIEREFLYVEFNREKIIQIDSATMATTMDTQLKNGVTSINEARERLNLQTVDGGNFRQVPVNVQSAAYTEQAEALKLEGLRLNNLLVAAQIKALETPQAPAPAPDPAPDPVADPVADPTDDDSPATPTDPVAEPANPDPGPATPILSPEEQLQNIFDEAVLGDPATDLCSISQAVTNKVANMYSIDPAKLETFRAAYIGFAAERMADNPRFSRNYEMSRMVNAVNLEAMTIAHGATCQCRWVGGDMEGQINPIGHCWSGKMRHPPLNEVDTECYLVRHVPAAA
jgi:HK97 family phage portal protein